MSLHTAKIAAMISAAESSGNIVKATREILQLLKNEGIAVEMRIQPNLIGVHPKNRDGLGVSLNDTETLLSNIFDLGFSEAEISAICVEANAEIKSYNMELMSTTMLPSYIQDNVKYASLSASHTNQCLRLVLANATHSDSRLTVDGRLSIEKISSKDSGLASACRTGISWLVLPCYLMEDHPTLPSLIQSAMNSAGQISRSESELQVLRRLHNYWLDETKKVGPQGRVDFNEVRRRAMASKPPCGNWLAPMYAFVLKHSGGQNASYLASTELFLRTQPCPVKVLGREFFDCLSCDIKGAVDQFVRVRHAILKAGYCIGLPVPDVKRLLMKEKDQNLSKAEAIILEIDEFTTMVSSSEQFKRVSNELMVMRGLFEVDVALKLIGKKNQSLEYLAHMFLSGVMVTTGVQFANRFAELAAEEIALAQESVQNKSSQTSADVQSFGLIIMFESHSI